LMCKRAAPTAIRFRNIGQQHAGRSCSGPGLDVWSVLLPPSRLPRRQLLIDEIAHAPAEYPHFVAHPGRLIGDHRVLLTSAATYPGAGEKLSTAQPESSPCVSPTRNSRAASCGASVTSKPSSGIERPSPSALTNASLRVQQLKKASGLSRSSSER